MKIPAKYKKTDKNREAISEMERKFSIDVTSQLPTVKETEEMKKVMEKEMGKRRGRRKNEPVLRDLKNLEAKNGPRDGDFEMEVEQEGVQMEERQVEIGRKRRYNEIEQ